MKRRKSRIKISELRKKLLLEEGRGRHNETVFSGLDEQQSTFWAGYASCARYMLRREEVRGWKIGKKRRLKSLSQILIKLL